MKLIRLVLAALAATVAVAPMAWAAKPSNAIQLRTTRVTYQSAVGTNTLTTWAGAVGDTLGSVRTDSLVVVDWVSYTSTSGSAEDWKVQIKDDAATQFFETGQTVAASTTDNMFLQFPTGLPLFNTATVSTVVTTGIAPCKSGYVLTVTGPANAGKLAVGWHLENPADRIR